jgi:hypothetical protein
LATKTEITAEKLRMVVAIGSGAWFEIILKTTERPLLIPMIPMIQRGTSP